MPSFIPQLKSNGHLNQTHMTIVSVGSRKINADDDFASGVWSAFAPHLSIYGFDADADACDAANAELATRSMNWTEQHIPLAIGKEVGEATLYVTKEPLCSSLYPPNEPYVTRFTDLIELMGYDFSLPFEITTLDQACESAGITAIDFLQIDVQGAELDVLKGAPRCLEQGVLAVQSEVEFSPLYQGQPLFADVDRHLRDNGFTLFKLAPAYRPRMISPIFSTANPGQLLWGDAFYLRDLLQAPDDSMLKTPANLLKLACIADALDFLDYALEVLVYLTRQHGADSRYNAANSIVESLTQFPELVEHGLGNVPVIQAIRDYVTGDALHHLT